MQQKDIFTKKYNFILFQIMYTEYIYTEYYFQKALMSCTSSRSPWFCMLSSILYKLTFVSIWYEIGRMWNMNGVTKLYP